MGAYYLVSRGSIKIGEVDHEECVLEVEELVDGEHLLEWSGAKVPILVNNDRLTIDVGGASGDLDNVKLPLDDQDLEKCQEAKILQIVLGPDNSRFWFSGESSHRIRKDVEWQEVPPKVDTLIELFKKGSKHQSHEESDGVERGDA